MPEQPDPRAAEIYRRLLAAYGEPRWAQVVDPTLAAALQAFSRQALHAWRLAFTHPITRERLAIEAAVPADLDGLLRASGLRLNG